MKEKIKNIFYLLIIFLIVVTVIYFAIIPVVEVGERYTENTMIKIQEADELCTNK